MTDQEPFVPPGEVLPPPTGAPRASSPPPPSTYGMVPPPPAARPGWLIPVVIGGGVVLLGVVGIIVAGAVYLGTTLRELPGGGSGPVAAPPAAPIDGDPGLPLANEPLDCVGCFTPADAARLRLAYVEYAQLGLEFSDGAPFDSTVGDELDLVEQQWSEVGGDPDSCFFAFPQAPLAHVLGDRSAAADDDHVHYPSWHYDEAELYWLTEGTRLFDESADATAHMSALASAIDGCGSYALPDTGWSSRVAPAPALDVPAEVAAYGWVETGGVNRYYVVDLQRGNLVMRIALNSAGGGPSELEFRGVVEAYAELLGALEPSG